MVAVIFGLVTGYFLWAWKRSVDAQSEKNWDPVVVAMADINPRTKITRDMITLSSFPKTLIAENTVKKLEDVEGRITLRQINGKDQIRATDLVQQGQTPGLAYDIPPGMRAIAIGAGEVMAVGTSVKPGDHVDILATYSDPRTRQELTKMLLQNVKVLAVNKGQTDQNGKDGANSSMTLAVKPEQTELVAAADRAGALRVSLRGVNDQVVVPTEGVSPRDFTGPGIPADAIMVTNEPNQTPVYIMPPAAQRPREIQIIRGEQQQTVSP
jgi:pilus assembly protein CpaB